MSNYKTNMELSILDNLFIERSKYVKQVAGNLKIAEVNNDPAFEFVVAHIKNFVSLTPVVFEEPKIFTHRETTREVPPNYNNLWGGPQNVFIVTVNFPFTGSPELFKYIPEGVPIPHGRIYQPSRENVPVEVTITALDREKALADAVSLMETTFAVVKANSEKAQTWWCNEEPVIDALLQQRRKELLDFYK